MKRFLFSALLLATLSGCASISTSLPQRCGLVAPGPYSGTRAHYHFPDPLTVIDGPLSFAMDTALLPITIWWWYPSVADTPAFLDSEKGSAG